MEYKEAVKKIAELMKDAKICMFTTVNEDGQLTSRPMGIQQVEFDGDAWFFTQESSDKVAELQRNAQVNISFQSGNAWVSVSGKADIVHDQAKAQELWNPLLKAWFPEGLDDPDLTLIKVRADSAEYWDSDNKLVTLLTMVKAAVTGTEARPGDNQTVQLN